MPSTTPAADGAPYVVERDGTLTLHFSAAAEQSSMRLDRPDVLHVDYTRTMMGFLLLHPAARRVALIGLGGGSIAKFCHRHVPAACVTAVEIDPRIVALRRRFGIPEDDGRLRVVLEDGARYVQSARGLDALLVDAFDAAGHPPALGTQRFYDDCAQALAPAGVAVFNLHVDNPGNESLLQRIAGTFAGNVLQVIAEEQSNVIVFAAGRRRPLAVEDLRTAAWRQALDAEGGRQLENEFRRIASEAHTP